MTRILIIIAFLTTIQMDAVMSADKDSEPTREEMIEYAVSLAEEMFSKLLGDEPITMEDDIKYFGEPFGASTYFFMVFEDYLGLIYDKSYEQIKENMPKYSPFLELIRMKKLLHPKLPNQEVSILVSDRQYQYEQDILTNKKLTRNQMKLANPIHITFIQRPLDNNLTTLDDRLQSPLIVMLEFVYDKNFQRRRFSSFTLNGQNIFKHLGFTSEKRQSIPPLRLLEELKAHLEELENRHNNEEKQADSE